MDCPETTIIIQNPDGTIQIATQPHYKNKKILECYKCNTRLIFEKTAKYVKCSNCQTVQGVPGQMMQQDHIIIECAGCTTILKTKQNSFAVQCPFCSTITSIQ